MCGIWAFIQGCSQSRGANPESIEKALALLRARGPETCEHVVYNMNGLAGLCQAHLGFTRLAINGLDASGNQPMFEDDKEGAPRVAWICNGEIYNWQVLKDSLDLHPTNQ